MKIRKNRVRLTTNVVPSRYEINLQPDLKKFVFEGTETIHLKLKKSTKSITLHAVDLVIESAEILGNENKPAQKISYDKANETATLLFMKAVPAGAGRLKLVFQGELNDKMHGFYRSSYEVHGQRRYMATTQFESTDARRAFPSFDEPAMKAVFEISLTVPSESTAISNTVPVEVRKKSEKLKAIRFAPTPLMSTYLLAFIVGDFEHIEKRSKDGILVRVFTTPGKKHQAQFALDAAAKIISFFNTYFDIPYPMPSLDMIAIPDFAAGAMENWGAITYRESALLVDPKNSSTINRQWVALVIAHEIAHQWFGNLVTMEWWTDLWLNEGFASFIEYLAVDRVFPEWDIWTQFLYADFGAALQYDGLKHTHPIEVEVHHPSEITAAFDTVSYSKGATILRMLADYLGKKDFRDGLRHYLKKHCYDNTSTVDLWNALSKVSGKSVTAMMKNWTGKRGYPLITVSENTTYFNLTQSRFFTSPISEKETRDPTVWQVPVGITTQDGKTQKPFLMSTRTERLPKQSDSWIKLNANESGFYRTNYPKRLQIELAEAVLHNKLKTRDRLGLVRDIMALAENGRRSTTEGLEFAKHYAKETEYVVWAEISSSLAKIHSLISQERFVKEYETFVLDIFTKIAKQARWNMRPKSHSGALLKILILENLSRYGDKATIVKAQKMFGGIRNGRNMIAADLRGVVYATVARYGDAKVYAKLMKMYKAETLHEEKNRIGRALGMFRQKNLLEKTLVFTLSERVRRQDSVRMIASVSINPYGRDVAWSFIERNWKTFLERYAGYRELSFLLEPIGLSTSVKRAKDMKQFIKKNPAPGTERTLQQVVERIHSNAVWLERDRRELREFLSK